MLKLCKFALNAVMDPSSILTLLLRPAIVSTPSSNVIPAAFLIPLPVSSYTATAFAVTDGCTLNALLPTVASIVMTLFARVNVVFAPALSL